MATSSGIRNHEGAGTPPIPNSMMFTRSNRSSSPPSKLRYRRCSDSHDIDVEISCASSVLQKTVAMRSLRALHDTHPKGKSLRLSIGRLFNREIFLRFYPQGHEDAPENYSSAFIDMIATDVGPLLVKISIDVVPQADTGVTANIPTKVCKDKPEYARFNPDPEGRQQETGSSGELQVDGWLDFCDIAWFSRRDAPFDSIILKICVEAFLDDVDVNFPDGSSRPVRRRSGTFTSDDSGGSDISAGQCLRNDLSAALSDGLHADLILIANDESEHQAHTMMLAARSPVFKTMLEPGKFLEGQKLGEGELRKINIDFRDGKLLHFFLDYVYTGRLGEDLFMDQYEALLVAAVKYEFNSLILDCVSALNTFMRIETVCGFLALASRLNCKPLKDMVLEFSTRDRATLSQVQSHPDFTQLDDECLRALLQAVIPLQGAARTSSDELLWV